MPDPKAPTPTDLDVTFCTVSFGSAPYLDLAHRLAVHLNPGLVPPPWLVIENTPTDGPHRVGDDDDRFRVLPGVDPDDLPDRGRASYHHGAALNRALSNVRTRFLLVVDPDFFPIAPDWIRTLVSHLRLHELAFLGAPWHPRWYTKWRGFPCPHCMLIDFERVERMELNFKPDTQHQPRAYHSPFLNELEWMMADGNRAAAWRRAMADWRLTWQEDRRRRLVVGSARDTGIRVVEQSTARPECRAECFQPVYRPYDDPLVPPPDVRLDTRSELRERLERVRPDWLSFVPKDRGSYQTDTFADRGLPSARAHDWEEFFFLGSPFAFHVRPGRHRHRRVADDIETARSFLARWLERNPVESAS